MSETPRIVQMALIEPGDGGKDGEYHFAMQPRFNPGRTVHFSLQPVEAEALHKALGAYLKAVRKSG